MAEDWAKVSREVEQAIASVGFQVTLIRNSLPANPWASAPSPTSNPVLKAVNTKLKEGYKPNSSESSQSNSITVSSEIKPDLKDFILMSGKQRKILSVYELAPAGQAVLYRLELET